MTLENDAPYCCGDDATLPEGVEIIRARFTGGSVAVCYRCDDFRCAYWECPCELVHECVTHENLAKCPKCKNSDATVLLDNDGEPYLCDSCWNDDGGDE